MSTQGLEIYPSPFVRLRLSIALSEIIILFLGNILSHIMNIFIYGVPGSGKTTIANKLAKSLNMEIFEADAVRGISQKVKNIKDHPYNFLPTTEAYKALGKRTSENVIKGVVNVRLVMKKIVNKKLSNYKNGVIFESAILDPNDLINKGLFILITIPSENQHKNQFLVHRTKEAFTNGQFENARIIQDYYINEAKNLKIKIFENSDNIENLTNEIQKYIINQKDISQK